MITAIIILSIILVLSIISIIIVGISYRWRKGDWTGIFMFIFALPLYALLKLIIVYRRANRKEAITPRRGKK